MHAAAAITLPVPETAPAHLLLLAERLARTLAVARALAMAGRHVDLGGIQDGVGALCAQALCLDRDNARHLIPALYEVMAQLDRLHCAMHPDDYA